MHVYLLAKPLLRTEYFVDVNFSTVLKIPEKYLLAQDRILILPKLRKLQN